MNALLWILIGIICLWGFIILAFVNAKFSDLECEFRLCSFTRIHSDSENKYKIHAVLKNSSKGIDGVANHIEIGGNELHTNTVNIGFDQFKKIVIKQID